MLVVPLLNDAGLPGNYEFNGFGLVGTMNETFPSGPNIPTDNALNSRTIQVDQQINFVFEWSIVGIFANSLNPNHKFQTELYFEKYGPGELDLIMKGVNPVDVYDGAGTVVSVIPGERSFTSANGNAAIVTIPPNTIEVGVYDVVAVIRYLDTANNPIFVAAFAEFGKMNFSANL